MPALCRDCFHHAAEDFTRCPACGSRRVIAHPDLFRLTVAHIDCDAFYASVEKRDQPELATRPVIVGGGTRGVVAACCYIARLSGVRSAMPMFKARAACPDAVVIKPDIAKYAREGARIRAIMEALTPLVQPLSIDEAVLDLRGTEALHNAPPAVVLARFAQAVEREVGVTVSVGLAANRLMAKLAAERDKPVWGRPWPSAWRRLGLCALGNWPLWMPAPPWPVSAPMARPWWRARGVRMIARSIQAERQKASAPRPPLMPISRRWRRLKHRFGGFAKSSREGSRKRGWRPAA